MSDYLQKLENASALYVNDMSYQAGLEKAKAILLPEIAKLERAEIEYKKYVIPLTIRQYATVIESNFPDIMEMNDTVPPKVWKRTKPHSRNLVTRRYKWFEILREGLESHDDYVVLLMKQVDASFKIDTNLSKDAEIDKTGSAYKGYLLKFCDSIVRAIEFGNKIVAHTEDGVDVFHSVIFGNVVDRYMKLFYNAMVEKLREPEVEFTTEE